MLRYLYYIRYFFYIAWNWNMQLALFTLYHEVRGEKKFGLNTSRLHSLKGLTITGNNSQYAEMYQGASYYLLEKIFLHLRTLHQGTVFTDLGCGKGRSLVVAAHYGFRQVTGVDFARELCDEAMRHCNAVHQAFPATSFRIVYADAAQYTIEESCDLLYFFNPFNAVVMQKVIKNILSSLKKHPRLMYVIYINPQHKQLFRQSGFKEIYNIRKMEFVEACILQKSL